MYGLLICLHGSALKSASRTAAVHIVAGEDSIGNHGYPAQLCILALFLCENDRSRQRQPLAPFVTVSNVRCTCRTAAAKARPRNGPPGPSLISFNYPITKNAFCVPFARFRVQS